MKRIITLFCLIIFYQLVSAQWEEIHCPSVDQYGIAYPQSMCCVGEDTLYLGYVNGVLVRSCDKCVTWNVVEVEPNPGIVDIQFYNNSVGMLSSIRRPTWISAIDDSLSQISYGQSLQKTTDGGASWILIDTSRQFERLFFVSQDTLYGIENYPDNSLYRSIDGGYSWQKVFSAASPIYDMSVLPDGMAYLLVEGKSVYKTSDFGQHWESVYDAGSRGITRGKVSAIHFWSEGDGEMIGPRRYYTSDDFQYVGEQELPWSSPSDSVIGVKAKYLDSGWGCVIGGTYVSGFKKMVLMTRDSGQTWSYCMIGSFGSHDLSNNPLVDVDGVGDTIFYVLQSEVGGKLYRAIGGFPAGVSQQACQPEVLAWPNPVMDVLHVKATLPICSAFVYDLAGKMILQQEYIIPQNYIEIFCNSLPQGTYILHVQNTQNIKSSVKIQIYK